jgi:hypothetical protein
MYETCHHIMPSGLRCQSPAMRGAAFCYSHGRRAQPHKSSEARIQLPDRLDRKGIARALREVLNALANNQISARRASILICGLQAAVANPELPAAASGQLDPDQTEFLRVASEIADRLGEKMQGAQAPPPKRACPAFVKS